jgi:hypothetical protein
MRTILAGLLVLLFTAGNVHAAEKSLPAPLELKYALRYGGLTIGHLTKTLTRETDGSYRHHSRSVPEGMAKVFTSVEWFEEGRFELVKGEVRPLSFLEYRVGADKPHRHSATFDWTNRTIHYAGWPDAPLPAGTQDQGSVLFALMLNPPSPGTEHKLHVSTGKKLREYRYLQVGTENLKTVFGTLRTQIIERRPLADDKDRETYRVWLAPDRQNLPVRVATEKRGQKTIMELESAKGGLPWPVTKP